MNFSFSSQLSYQLCRYIRDVCHLWCISRECWVERKFSQMTILRNHFGWRFRNCFARIRLRHFFFSEYKSRGFDCLRSGSKPNRNNMRNNYHSNRLKPYNGNCERENALHANDFNYINRPTTGTHWKAQKITNYFTLCVKASVFSIERFIQYSWAALSAIHRPRQRDIAINTEFLISPITIPEKSHWRLSDVRLPMSS